MLENEITLYDFQVKLLLKLFEGKELDEKEKELKEKLEECIYGC